MNYKEQLLIDINQIYNENTIPNKSFINDFVNEILDKSPNDDFIISITPKWYKRSQSIEFIWNLDDLEFGRKVICYRISENKSSWRIDYHGNKFNERNKCNDDFFNILSTSLNDIKQLTEAIIDWYNAKPATKGEFYNMLVMVVEQHISSSIRNKEYRSEKMVLGINRDSLRPEIDKVESLLNHDIYDLKNYTKCFFIDPNDGCGFWELEDEDPFWQLAELYIKEESNEVHHIEKITSNEFRMLFYKAMYEYLSELNSIKSGRTSTLLKITAKLGKKKYLGVEPKSLTPYIGIIEGLDGCDLYDLEKIQEIFLTDKNGFFVLENNHNRKFIVKDKSLINLLVDKYFTDKDIDHTILPLIKKAEEHIIDDDSMFIKAYKANYRDMFYSYTTIIGKYADTSYYGKFSYRPKSLQEYVDFLEKSFKKFEEDTYKATVYLDKAKEHKRNRKYKLAITALEKAITLVHNIEQTGYPEIHSCLIDCYAKIKDKENQIRVIKLAIDLYGSSKFKGMLNKVAGTITETILNKDSYQVVAECNYGEMYDKHVRRNLPEFSFGKNKIDYRVLERAHMLPVIRQIDKHFHDLLNEAKEAETLEYYDKAVELYERLIAEGTYTSTAYERLIVLYSKANRKNDLIRILQSGISFFEARKSSQAEYARALAKKYNAEEYCEMCIRIGLTIPYNYGYIVLYQNYPFVDKWKKRLAKLIQ